MSATSQLLYTLVSNGLMACDSLYKQQNGKINLIVIIINFVIISIKTYQNINSASPSVGGTPVKLR